MIYTIGHHDNYMRAIAQYGEGQVTKTGKRSDSPGGYAFKTIEDAQRRINESYSTSGYAVFGMDAEWETDTEPSADGWWHNLLVDSVIHPLDAGFSQAKPSAWAKGGAK